MKVKELQALLANAISPEQEISCFCSRTNQIIIAFSRITECSLCGGWGESITEDNKCVCCDECKGSGGKPCNIENQEAEIIIGVDKNEII